MKKSNVMTLLFSSLGLMVLIFDGQTAITGIQCGIEICLRTLIPSLLPFFVITGAFTDALLGQNIPIMRSIGKICRIPDGSESLFAAGILGGYPVGAKNIRDAKVQGHLSGKDARRMAVFCNNPGPSFLFGMIGPMFPNVKWVWALWLIQIIGAVLTGIFLPGGSKDKISFNKQTHSDISEILLRSLKSMALVCGWVTLFRMLLEFFNRWILWLFPPSVQVLISGMLELSNGCIRLKEIQELPLRFLIASVLLSLGGICVLMQTRSVFPGLDLKSYLTGKLLQSSIGIGLTLAVLPLLYGNIQISLPILIIFTLLLVTALTVTRKRKKEVAIP